VLQCFAYLFRDFAYSFKRFSKIPLHLSVSVVTDWRVTEFCWYTWPALYYKKSNVYSAKICLLALFFQLLTMLRNVFSFSLHSFLFSISFCVFCGMVICLCDSGIRWGALTQEWTKLFLAATHLLLFKVCAKGRVRETDDFTTSYQSCVTLSSLFECLFTSYHSYSSFLTLFICSHGTSASCFSCHILLLLMFESNTASLPQP